MNETKQLIKMQLLNTMNWNKELLKSKSMRSYLL